MAVKTKEGWATRKQIARQEKAWRKARAQLMAKLQDAVNDSSKLDSMAEKVFAEFDADKNGSIDMKELKSAFETMGVVLTKNEVNAMVAEADEDGDGQIDMTEFKSLVRLEVQRYKARSQTCVIL